MAATATMKYRLGILNTAAFLFLAGCILYTVINYEGLSVGEGWGVAYMVGLAGFGASALVVDLFLQMIFKRKSYLNIAGSIALLIYVIIFFLGT
jgi:hypothetical protein